MRTIEPGRACLRTRAEISWKPAGGVIRESVESTSQRICAMPWRRTSRSSAFVRLAVRRAEEVDGLAGGRERLRLACAISAFAAAPASVGRFACVIECSPIAWRSRSEARRSREAVDAVADEEERRACAGLAQLAQDDRRVAAGAVVERQRDEPPRAGAAVDRPADAARTARRRRAGRRGRAGRRVRAWSRRASSRDGAASRWSPGRRGRRRRRRSRRARPSPRARPSRDPTCGAPSRGGVELIRRAPA